MEWCQELLSKEGNVKVSASVFTKQVPLALSNIDVHKALKDSALCTDGLQVAWGIKYNFFSRLLNLLQNAFFLYIIAAVGIFI